MTTVTAACGPHIYRGDHFPAEFRGNAFVCEPSGNLISRQVLTAQGPGLTATSVHTDVDFLVSTDERFRPVNLATGPDGALYIADFHHGILQHRNFLSAYLRDQIAQRGLAQPLHLGRIFRIVHESAAPGPRPALGRAATSDLVKALAHPNGWWRDTAQRLLVEHADAAAVPALKQLAAGDVASARCTPSGHYVDSMRSMRQRSRPRSGPLLWACAPLSCGSPTHCSARLPMKSSSRPFSPS